MLLIFEVSLQTDTCGVWFFVYRDTWQCKSTLQCTVFPPKQPVPDPCHRIPGSTDTEGGVRHSSCHAHTRALVTGDRSRGLLTCATLRRGRARSGELSPPGGACSPVRLQTDGPAECRVSGAGGQARAVPKADRHSRSRRGSVTKRKSTTCHPPSTPSRLQLLPWTLCDQDFMASGRLDA